MPRYCINNREVKFINDILKKSGEMSINAEAIRGIVTIDRFRQYQWCIDLDISFKGEIMYGGRWIDLSSLESKRFSVVRVNRYIRTRLFNLIRTRLYIFSVKMADLSNIKKIKWI